MFKRAYLPFIAVCLTVLAGCAALGIAPADTFNKRVAMAYAMVDQAYELAADLNEMGKLTPEKKAEVLKQLDDVLAAVDSADALKGVDLSQADQRLTAALMALDVIDAYLRSQA